MATTLRCTFDGACEPFNPGGAMGLGWTIGGQGHHAYVPKDYKNTNNVAEYLALDRLLDALLAMEGIESVVVSGNNDLVINQLSGENPRIFIPSGGRPVRRSPACGTRVWQ